ncbi:MAG TPA: nickel-binding protein [Candidatus Binatia bacterium]|nr:nickel-binding protein [Candidatus Binatia bacterium]
MPVYMDRHYIEGATRHAVADAHQKDLALQDKYHVKFITYWFDEMRSTAFCLIEAADRKTIERAHAEAHGSIPNEVLEVDPAVVDAFLGRIKDPPPVEKSSGKAAEIPIDPGFRAIMFTDLKDSTLMTTLYGDTKALHLLHVHNALTRNSLNTHEGREVKHMGDGIMASFRAVPNAVGCAIAIQKAFAAYNEENRETPLYLRIGLSAGEPIEEHGDLFGKPVQLASRLCAHAEPAQILADQLVRDQCSGENLPFSDFGEATLKGFANAVRVYAVNWTDLEPRGG